MYRAVIVDDESFVLDGIKAAIDWSGFNFELSNCTTNPCDALDFLENHPTDLLITDISMPQMNGIDLIKKAREINPLISILVLSAYDNFEYVRSAMRHGAENYLLKPLDPNELTESISHIAAHIQERAELSGTYGSTMLTFRSNFVENWVKGSLSEDEFITRAQMLGVNLYLDNYTVMMFKSPPSLEEHGKEKMAALFDYLLTLFVGTYITHFYFETPTCLVCIVSSPEESHTIGNLLAQMDKARIALNFPFFLSTGNTVDNYEDVSDSYRNASKYVFLAHTSMKGITHKNMELAVSVLSIIEQDFSDISKEDYLRQMNQLLSSLSPSRHRAVFLSIISWGIYQTTTDTQPESEIIKILESIDFKSLNRDSILSYLDAYIHTCLHILQKKQETQTATYPCVDAVIAAVHEFSDKEISLKTLAAKLKMHPSYLGSIFRQQTGLYFNDYLNEERLKYATNLIETTDMKLKDIVDKAGFSSQTYFNRQFKSRYGTSPNAYRREIKLKKLT